MSEQQFESFRSFYPYYLAEHRNGWCRLCHLVGSLLSILVVLVSLLTQEYLWVFAAPLFGYGWAWLGHFVFEHNRPATFKYPRFSFIGDWVMLKDILTGQFPLLGSLPEEVLAAVDDNVP